MTKPGSSRVFLEQLIVAHDLHSARWKKHAVQGTENVCTTLILENTVRRRSSSSVPNYVLVILPLNVSVNYETLTKAVKEEFLSQEEGRVTHFTWQTARLEPLRRFFDSQVGIDASTLTSTDPCPLWASPDPCRAPRIPTFLCQTAVKPFLWLPTGDKGTTLGLSLRDLLHAVQPTIVRGLSAKPEHGVKEQPKDVPAVQQIDRVNSTTDTEKTHTPSQSGISNKPKEIATSSLSLKAQKNQGIVPKNVPLAKLSVKDNAPKSAPGTDPVPTPTPHRYRSLARRENPVISVRNQTPSNGTPHVSQSPQSQPQDEVTEESTTILPDSSHDDDYTSEDDGNTLDALLSDDDDLAMLNQLTMDGASIADDNDPDNEEETIDFEETATTGELGLEEELLEDSRHATVTERVTSNYRVERIRHFERRTPSRTISVEEHPESDPEDIAEAEAPPPVESQNRPAPRRRRRRRKLRQGNENFERRTPSRSVSVSEHPEFDPECLEETGITEAKAPAVKEFTRKTPSRAISTSEHPSFDVEATITEAVPPRSQTFTRRTPSRAISTSEHPSFDVEATITEAVPPRSQTFTRRTPSRAISTSEHPDFDLEEHVVEAVAPRGLSDIARQVELDLEQDRREQALAEATFASESTYCGNILEEGMPTAEDIGEEEGSSDEESEEEETLHVEDEATETQVDEPTDTQEDTQETETSTLE